MKLRGGTGSEIPEQLVRYNPDDWVGPANSLEYQTPHDLGRPHIRWGNARCKWASEHIHTVEDFDRLLFGPDVVFPPEGGVGSNRDLTCILGGHYEWRRPRVF